MICFRFASTENLDGSPRYQGIAGLTGRRGTFGSSSSLTLDGKTISAATLNGSGVFCSGVTDLHGGLPVMVHEFGHYLFGGVHYEGVGFHGLMDGAGTGVMSSFERYKLGWITPTTVSANLTNETITDALSTNDIYKITAQNGSYFLVENHQRQNFYESDWLQYNDGPLVSPGTGILISHCTSSSIDIESAFGRWDWDKEIYHWTNPSSLNGTLYTYPFLQVSSNRNDGDDKLNLRGERIDPNDWRVTASHSDSKGSQDDFFSTSYNRVFSPWSNPSSSYDINNNTNISVVVKGSTTIDIMINDLIITENTTFPAEIFNFSHNLTVPSGVTLTLQPGTTLKFASGKSLIVNGTLDAV